MTIPKILKNKTLYLKYSPFRKKKNQTNDASKRYLYLFYTTLQLTWVAHYIYFNSLLLLRKTLHVKKINYYLIN